MMAWYHFLLVCCTWLEVNGVINFLLLTMMRNMRSDGAACLVRPVFDVNVVVPNGHPPISRKVVLP